MTNKIFEDFRGHVSRAVALGVDFSDVLAIGYYDSDTVFHANRSHAHVKVVDEEFFPLLDVMAGVVCDDCALHFATKCDFVSTYEIYGKPLRKMLNKLDACQALSADSTKSWKGFRYFIKAYNRSIMFAFHNKHPAVMHAEEMVSKQLTALLPLWNDFCKSDLVKDKISKRALKKLAPAADERFADYGPTVRSSFASRIKGLRTDIADSGVWGIAYGDSMSPSWRALKLIYPSPLKTGMMTHAPLHLLQGLSHKYMRVTPVGDPLSPAELEILAVLYDHHGPNANLADSVRIAREV